MIRIIAWFHGPIRYTSRGAWGIPLPKSRIAMSKFFQLFVILVFSANTMAVEHPGSAEFVDRAVSEYGFEAAEIKALLADANFKQSIVDAISRPAEGKPWHEYRPIFLNPQRIREGVAFWEENRDVIRSVSEQFGVDPQIIVSIIGVETLYGRITGSYRVLDALATLGFYYPSQLKRDRSGFFFR